MTTLMDETRLAEVAERVALWHDYGDCAAARAADARWLLDQVSDLRAQNRHVLSLLHRARAELHRIAAEYDEARARLAAAGGSDEP